MDIFTLLRMPHNSQRIDLIKKYNAMLSAYQMTIDFSDDEQSCDLAKKKLERLKEAGDREWLTVDPTLGENGGAEYEALSQIRLAFSTYDSGRRPSEELLIKLDSLPDSAEKHYYKALSFLLGTTNYFDAIKEINMALSIQPDNQAYRMLEKSIQTVIDAYTERLKAAQAAAESEKRKAEEKAKAVLDEQRMAARKREDEKIKKLCSNSAIVCIWEVCSGCCV